MQYNPPRKQNIYDSSLKKYRLSRSKLEDFIRCPKCFYLDRKLGIAQPPSFPFNLNQAVDTLLKKEFDLYRASGTPHPLMKEYKVNAVPYSHDSLELWREALRGGITYFVPGTNLYLTGAVDDLWIDRDGNLIIVDYKATSKSSEVNIDADWQDSYKRQMEIYQYLFKKNNFKVSDLGYFVYANGDSGADAFNHCLKFDIKIIPYKGDDSWVDQAVLAAFECLQSEELPASNENCDFCKYRKVVGEREHMPKQRKLL